MATRRESIFRSRPPETARAGRPFVTAHADRFLCFGSNGRILELDPASETGWVELARHPSPVLSLAPAIKESSLVFEDTRGLLCSYSLPDMVELWKAPVQHRRADLLPAASLPSGALAFAAASGQLYVFDGGGHLVTRVPFRKRFLADLSLTAAGAIIGANGGRLIALDASSL